MTLAILAVWLLAAAPGQPSIADAVMDGDAKAVAALVAQGADVNQKDSQGITPLMQAASAGRLEILRLLIASVDKAREMGINWWESDPALSNGNSQRGELEERLERLEAATGIK